MCVNQPKLYYSILLSLLSLMLNSCSGAQEVSTETALESSMPTTHITDQQMESCRGLRLNEVNPNGTPDWIEIYNTSIEPMNLANCYLSDDLEMPFKAQLEALSVAPGAFVILEVSDESVGFKLGKSEAVLLSTIDGEVVDFVEYRQEQFLGQETLGRVPDGIGAWTPLASASPSEPNVASTAILESDMGGIESDMAGIESDRAGIESDRAGIESDRAGTDSIPAGIESEAGMEILTAGVEVASAGIDMELGGHDMLEAGTDPEDLESTQGTLLINEIAAKGDPSDWIELLYLAPAESPALDVSAYRLGDQDDLSLASPLNVDFIQPQERLIIEINDETLGFKLGSDEAVYLWDSNGHLIDFYDWDEGASPEGGSLSRVPDGVGEFITTLVHTRGSENH